MTETTRPKTLARALPKIPGWPRLGSDGRLALVLWLVAPLVGVALAWLWLGASSADLRAVAEILLVSEALSIASAWAIFHLGLRLRLASVHLKVSLTFALGLGITLFNILLVSSQMFLSPHDSTLLVILLIFAGLVALGFGYLISRSITRNLDHLAETAEKVSGGELGLRAAVRSGDEVERLAAAFNDMLQRLHEMQERERTSQQARRDLVAAVSHDVRTPVATLRAMVEALNDGVVSDEMTRQRYLKLAQQELVSLSRLLDDLFELTQQDTVAGRWTKEPGPLRDLISDVLESMRLPAEQTGVELSGRVDPAVDPVPMEALQIQRVLYNLIQNALHHTPTGGRVTVTARLVDGGQAVEVGVSDTGEGIPPDELPHVFEAFYRGERSRSRHTGGAGLGLAIARGIVEAHGGTLEAQSQPGQGSAFRFTLERRLELS